jgi:hypothetical protein
LGGVVEDEEHEWGQQQSRHSETESEIKSDSMEVPPAAGTEELDVQIAKKIV